MPNEMLNYTFYGIPPAVSDAVYVAPKAYISKDLNKDIELTVGQWKLVIANPSGDLKKKWIPKEDLVQYFDEQTLEFKQKKYTIDRTEYRETADELDIYITIYENPIPLFILYGAVVSVVSVVLAWATGSVLKSVEKVVAKIPESVTELGKSPIVWGLLLIFLIPVLISAKKSVT